MERGARQKMQIFDRICRQREGEMWLSDRICGQGDKRERVRELKDGRRERMDR